MNLLHRLRGVEGAYGARMVGEIGAVNDDYSFCLVKDRVGPPDERDETLRDGKWGHHAVTGNFDLLRRPRYRTVHRPSGTEPVTKWLVQGAAAHVMHDEYIADPKALERLACAAGDYWKARMEEVVRPTPQQAEVDRILALVSGAVVVEGTGHLAVAQSGISYWLPDEPGLSQILWEPVRIHTGKTRLELMCLGVLPDVYKDNGGKE